jgi:predicted Zn-dependent protease
VTRVDPIAEVDPVGTLAEALGLTGELADAIARVAEGELAAGRADVARTLLEGLVVANPRDALAWTLLSRTHRALAQPLAARFCAEVAAALEPRLPAARLARAEGLLAFPEERTAAVELLRGLAHGPGGAETGEGVRATALLAALGRPGVGPPSER